MTAAKMIANTLRLMPRAALITLMLAVPSMRAAETGTIEAPAAKKTGAGFVLLVSLQRG